MNYKLLLYITIYCISAFTIKAQNEVVNNTEVSQDTTLQDSAYTKRNTFKEVFSGKPGRAALYSLIIPGGGQIYNKKWWKLPITYAIEGGALSWLLYNRYEYKYYDRKFQEFVNNDGFDPNPNDGISNQATAKSYRDQSRKKTEYAWVFMGLAHLYNVFDAYVDRHLMDFDISEDLTIQAFPSPTPYGYAALGLGYKF